MPAGAQAKRLRIGCEKAYKRRGLKRKFTPPPPWRPTGKGSQFQFILQYGWWAFNHAQRRTALIYAGKALTHNPLAREPWALLRAAALKPLPAPPRPPHELVDLHPRPARPRSDAPDAQPNAA